MNLLRIEQTYGRIGVETYKSQMDIQSQQSKLTMRRIDSQLNIEKQMPVVKIDQHACFATAGLKNVFELTEEAAQLAKQQALQYTAQKAVEGDMLANIKGGGNPIAEIARSNSYEQHEFNIDNIPKERPRIEVEGNIKLEFNKGQIQTNVEEGSVNTNYSKAKVNIYLSQKPSINIQYVGGNIDTYR